MSLNITSVIAAKPLPVVGRTAPARPSQAGGSDAVLVDLSSSRPSTKEPDTSAAASQSGGQLTATGMRVNVDDRTGKVKVAVYDMRGNVLFTVPSSNGDPADDGTA
jgi:hypothetical protein